MGRIYKMPTRRCRRPGRVALAASLVLMGACVPPRRMAFVEPAPAVETAYAVSVAAAAAREAAIRDSIAADSARAGSGDASAMHDSSLAAAPVPGPVAADPVAEGPVAEGPAWDLDVEANASRQRVAYFVDAFSGRLREAFERALSRQTAYSGLIGDRLAAAGLPLDLTYLAFVESYYDPDAYSKAAAVGMWQFMAGTARGVGLRVDWWVDERRDPVRATEGAVRLLSSLHDSFGSFFLSAAAYNGGEGRVSRGISQFAARLEGVEGEARYFALSDTRYLRPETRDYVPKIIAAALVAKQPDRYGLHVDSLAPFAFDSVMVPGGTPLAAVAAAVPTVADSIRDLNPHILRGMVPPGDSMWVRVPVATADGFADRFAALDATALVAVTRVKSKKGESMVSIARRNRMTSKQLGWYNPRVARLKSGNLVTGQTILVPSHAVVAVARDVPNPSIERYPRRARSRPRTRPATTGGAPAKASVKPPAKARTGRP